jgi:sugar phosphate isomerase/epimerase
LPAGYDGVGISTYFKEFFMYSTLSAGAVNVHVDGLEQLVAAAKTGGFVGVEFSAGWAADRIETDGVAKVKDIFESAGVKPAVWGLGVDWRNAEEPWKAGLEALPRLAAAGAALGCYGTATFIMPASNDRALEENRAFHIARLTPVAKILADHGCSIGLEFVGPKTLRDKFTHPFLWTMEDMLGLAEEIGPNVGLLVDCYHWYTSHSSVDALLTLRPEKVVYVHLNDAPAGIPVDEQQDGTRCLPGETGVIDVTGFLQALDKVGYKGPAAPEPFKKELKDLPTDADRLKLAGAATNGVLQRAGVHSA